jgi:HAD superfamily hydrolase (TIGR01509 family)
VTTSPVQAVVFDLDGIILDSEQTWNEARTQLARQYGRTWTHRDQVDMMGSSPRTWPAQMAQKLSLPLAPEDIRQSVVGTLLESYKRSLPIVPRAPEVARALATNWPLGLASSSDRAVIDYVLELADLSNLFTVTVSSEEVDNGKPSPDIYLETCRRMGVDPKNCVAIEDSWSGLVSAASAGLAVIAIPNKTYQPSREFVQLADVTLQDISDLTPAIVMAAIKRHHAANQH